MDVENYNSYVTRTIRIPDGADPEKITTGVVVKPDGTTYHVPTRVTLIDGVYYAVINSLTNSTYTVVWNPMDFSDMEDHWAQDAVNNMGSRMIVEGVGDNNYDPDGNITRAEFAAIVVRALGLEQKEGASSFADVDSAEWYCGYIETAYAYGIIEGYDNGDFGPNDTVIREQAITMIGRAMALTGLDSELTGDEVLALLAPFTDGTLVSEYAQNSMAACIETEIVLGTSDTTLSPELELTRAEGAAMVQRLLAKSGLI